MKYYWIWIIIIFQFLPLNSQRNEILFLHPIYDSIFDANNFYFSSIAFHIRFVKQHKFSTICILVLEIARKIIRYVQTLICCIIWLTVSELVMLSAFINYYSFTSWNATKYYLHCWIIFCLLQRSYFLP